MPRPALAFSLASLTSAVLGAPRTAGTALRALSSSAACTRTRTSMVVSNAKVFIAAIFLMTAVGCWSAVGNAAFIAPRGKTIFARSHKRTWTGLASTDRCDPTHARFRCDVAGVRFCIVLYRLYRRGPSEAPKIRTPPNVGGLRSLPAQIRFWAWKQPASDRDELRVVVRQARQVGDARVGGLERETLSVGMGFRRPPSATPEAPPIRSIGYPCNINLAKPVVAAGRSAESHAGCSTFGQSSSGPLASLAGECVVRRAPTF